MAQVEIQWSHAEKQIAKAAIKKAYDREIAALLESVKKAASQVSKSEDAWELHDFLSAKRHNIDGKYDERESFLLFTLSNLIKEGLIERSDLEGLASDKYAKITLLSRM